MDFRLRGANIALSGIVAITLFAGTIQGAQAQTNGSYKVAKPATPSKTTQTRTTQTRTAQSARRPAATQPRSNPPNAYHPFKPSYSPTLQYLKNNPSTGQNNGRGAPSASKQYDNAKGK